jgi:RNA polymerase sigma-70 factor (ECF subfamily)
MTVSEPSVELLAAARDGERAAFDELVRPHRRAILEHCYRMLGSFAEAEELAQETLLRAWQRIATFEARGSFRGWLHRIATNLCLNALAVRPVRRLPHDVREPSDPLAPLGPRSSEPIWIGPLPDEPIAGDLEQDVLCREQVSLAFVAALQRLTPGQRAALLLCDVLGFRASEAASAIDTTLDGLNGLLHRARAAVVRAHEPGSVAPTPEQHALLARFVTAWERGDVAGLAALLADDALLAMPPVPTWFRGRDAIAAFLASPTFAAASHGGFKLRPTRANGGPAFAFYRREAGRLRAHSLMVVTPHAGQVREMVSFLDPTLVTRFGFPAVDG